MLLAAQTLKPLEPPTLHVSSRIVYVDVVVRNSRGEAVRGLAGKDFRITEDGRPQNIDLFRAYTHDPAQIAGTPAAKADAAKLEFSNATAGKTSDTVNMILFDLLDTSLANQTYARKQMLKFLAGLPPGHKIALFILSDRLHMLQNFTGNSDLLAEAAGLLLPKAGFLFHSASDQARDADVMGLLPASMKAGGEDSFTMDLVDELAKENFAHDQQRNSMTNTAFRELAEATAAYSGRKNLIWLSESFPLGAITSLQTFHSPLGSFFMADLTGEAAKPISDSRIAVYPISLSGLETGGVNAALNGTTAAGGSGAALGGGQAIGNSVATLDPETQGGEAAAQPGGLTGGARLPDTLGMQANARFALRDQLDEIARQTGGEAFVGTNDFAGAMRKSLEEGENYYSLAYTPTNQKWTGKFRSIHVELAPKGYSLSYRRGYFAVAEAPRPTFNNAQELDIALHPATPELDTIPIRSKVYLPNLKRATLQVDALLGAKAVNFTVGDDGDRTAQLLVEMIAIPQSTNGEPMGQTTEDLSFHLSEAQYQVAANNGLPLRLQLALKPGRYRIRLGVSDRSNHRIGSVDMPVEIPAN